MGWLVDILVIILLILSIVGGVREGAIKQFFSLVALIVAIPVAGISYQLIAGILSFLPGINWEYFFGFCITLAIINGIMFLILLIPRKILQKIWKKGCLFKLIGGLLGLFGAGISLTLFAVLLRTYPIFDWLARWVDASGVMTWLVNLFGFVPAMLPAAFHQISSTITF